MTNCHVMDDDDDDGDNNQDNISDDMFDIADLDIFDDLFDIFLGSDDDDDDMVPLEMDVTTALSVSLASIINNQQPELTVEFGDFIQDYFNSSLLFHSIASSSLLNLPPENADTLAANALFGTFELYVKNIPKYSKEMELIDFFIQLGYKDIRKFTLKTPSRASWFGFAEFSTSQTAEHVLFDYKNNPSKFNFKSVVLFVNRANKPKKQPKRSMENDEETELLFPIHNIQYGTLITGPATKNIIDSNQNHASFDHGCIISSLLAQNDDRLSYFKIDQNGKKFSIIIKRSFDEIHFQWSFRDLKGERIAPVYTCHIIHGSNVVYDQVIDPYVYLLVEIKRPPVISYVGHDEIRLRGNLLIGQSNVWLFQLGELNIESTQRNLATCYIDMFTTLARYSLCKHPFDQHNIQFLISSRHAPTKLKNVLLLSNEKWVNDHRTFYDNFIHKRWSSYNFEIKFELMKLISKHIITAHDLIVDETLENILSRLSRNTFIACTDKIGELAFRWKSSYENNDDEEEDEEEVEQPSHKTQHKVPSVTVKSTWNDIIDSSSTHCIPIKNKKMTVSRVIKQVKNQRIGALSRLLLLAINELKNKRELCKTTKNFYVTKHELKTLDIESYLIRKIYVTPCRILYEGPYREEKNSVTRYFDDVQHGFIRISFRDEDYRKLSNGNENMTKLYEYIEQVMYNGISICDRKYEFLAFSSSQLRDHSAWMFAKNTYSSKRNEYINATSIRQWMGHFGNIRPVSKYAARLGQSFSTTVQGTEVEKYSWTMEKDVFTPSKHCFTDGIGIVSKQLCEKLSKQLKLEHPACAFQIRFGGSKGMICLDVANKIRDPTIELFIRPSMEKFISLNKSINIVRSSSSSSPAFLNRQIILLLSSLGIANTVFLNMQNEILRKIINITENSIGARELLKELIDAGSKNFCHMFMFDCLKRFGTKIDPLLRQMLLCFQAFLVKELRTKARILVKHGACLLGVIDETRTLKYGQVFIQIEQYEKPAIIIQKPVIVTKNPCFHPGDIRLLDAIDVPKLHQLTNVIVFPMDGDRPLTLEISGSDLDGDVYFVSWDKRLIFSSNESPLDYHDQALEAEKQALSDPNQTISIENVCKFFSEYIEADNLGLIANRHLAFADQLPLQAKNDKCIQLAKMHSIAVDFAKNGVCAPKLT
ncbi:unnamed protein product, partial [Didymodactylos carnosus]